MQDYVVWFNDDLGIDWWCGNYQMIDNMNILHVKRITLKNL
jgi:hypothetical protein